MKKLLLLLAAIFVLSFTAVRAQTATSVITKMYDRYHTKWRSSLKFNQSTEIYTDGKLSRSETWYETIVYPYMLRIDIGEPKSKKGILFLKDSAYVFKNDTITQALKRTNPLIFLVGGMYKMPFDDVLKQFIKDYDFSKIHTTTWKGKKVYVIGALTDEEAVNQLWIDQDKLVALRLITYDKGIKSDDLMENHVLVAGTWSETYCTFYNNGVLRQVEQYHDLKANEPVDMTIFDPALMTRAAKH